MIVGACSTVLSPIFSRMAHEKVNLNQTAYPLWNSVYKKTALLIYPIIVYCWVFADVIMVVLYGGKYETSQIYFRIKILTYIFSLIVFAPFLINTGKVKFYARVTAIFAVLIWSMEYISVLLTDSPYSVFIMMYILRWLLDFCNMQTPIVMLFSSLISYIIIYLVYSKMAKLDYLSIIKPLISKK